MSAAEPDRCRPPRLVIPTRPEAGAVVTEFYCCMSLHRDDNGESKFSFVGDEISTTADRADARPGCLTLV